MRYVVLVLSLLIIVGAAFYYVSGPNDGTRDEGRDQRARRGGASTSTPSKPGTSTGRSSGEPSDKNVTSGNAPANSTNLEADFPIAAGLNAPDSNVARDLDIVRQIFEAWQSNFPREGNPVGENAEITAALMGENRLGFALIPKGHRAVNAAGELCDRWGTPFRFHQLSGTRMEIRSAGPDRRFATEDDAVWTPQ